MDILLVKNLYVLFEGKSATAFMKGETRIKDRSGGYRKR
jgi:hypothetical protein